MKPSTKACPDCGNTHLVCISTQNIKLCADCGAVIKWTKEDREDDYI